MKSTLYFLALILFVSCSTGDTTNKASTNETQKSSSKADAASTATDVVSLKGEIDKMEEFFKANGNKPLDKTKASLFVDKSVLFVNLYPDHEMSPAFLFRAAEVSRALKKYEQGVKMLDQVYTQYPQHEKAPAALFLKAYTYEESLKDPASAKKYYNEFLQKFPNHDLKVQVEQLLSVIDKSPEELIKSFQKKNQ